VSSPGERPLWGAIPGIGDALQNWVQTGNIRKSEGFLSPITDPSHVPIPTLDAQQKGWRDTILQDLLRAQTTPPGERVMTSSFVKKRASLQDDTEKRAASTARLVRQLMKTVPDAPRMPGMLSRVFSGRARAEARQVSTLHDDVIRRIEAARIHGPSNPAIGQTAPTAPHEVEQLRNMIQGELTNMQVRRGFNAGDAAKRMYLDGVEAEARAGILRSNPGVDPATLDRLAANARSAANQSGSKHKDLIEQTVATARDSALKSPLPGTVHTPITDNPGMKGLLGLGLGSTALIGGTALTLNNFADPTTQRAGFGVRSGVYPNIMERLRLDEVAADSFANAIGKEMGKSTVGLLGDLASKAVASPGDLVKSMQRKNVFDQLQEEDDVIARADPAQLDEAYHTMVRFAPTLATDKNAVKTFLRESVLYGTGPNFVAIKQLADAERAVSAPPSVVVKK